MIKYLGSKRTLVPVLGDIATAVEARTALDVFTGTTRVAQELKRRGLHVTAVDSASYSGVLSDCYVATDATVVDRKALEEAFGWLEGLPPVRGYFTRTFCEQARFLQPKNGMRVDAIRAGIEERYAGSPLRPVLLAALLVSADRVDSTTGVQMAYLKQWAPRASRDLVLLRPQLLPGPGRTVVGDALAVASSLGPVDLAYFDPPYNQHRYFTNYHVWETLVRWDAPAHYGVACKRLDARDPSTRSVFNRKATIGAALAELFGRVRAGVAVVSYNDESWVTPAQMIRALKDAGHAEVRLLAFDRKRYVGAQIGIHSPSGEKVGTVSHLRNTEYVFVAGPAHRVERAVPRDRDVAPSLA